MEAKNSTQLKTAPPGCGSLTAERPLRSFSRASYTFPQKNSEYQKTFCFVGDQITVKFFTRLGRRASVGGPLSGYGLLQVLRAVFFVRFSAKPQQQLTNLRQRSILVRCNLLNSRL